MPTHQSGFKLLEINVISAQDLPPVSKMLRTFAVAYVRPDNKLTTRIDHHGHTNPTWNYKIAFHVDDKFLKNESSVVAIEIYNLAWLRDLPIGTARLAMSSLSPNLLRNPGFRRVSLRICRPSGHLQGILNLGVQLVDNYLIPGCGISHHEELCEGDGMKDEDQERSSKEEDLQAPPPTPMQLLEISLISAQDLTPVSKSMRTYAVAWVNPSRKLTTRTDQHGLTHPTWNEKLTFRVDNQFLLSDDAAITVEIYTASWFREVLVGTVRVLISDLLAPPSGTPLRNHPKSIRFVALQVRRPSGTPQGILNMGVAILDSSTRSMPLRNNPSKSPARGDDFLHAVEKKVNVLNLEQKKNEDKQGKAHLWRSLSLGSEVNDEFPAKNGSIYNPGSTVNGSACNGSSIVNGSELCSDIGPSASIVAAELAKKGQPPPQPLAKRPTRYDETGSSILEELTFEEAMAKGYRIRTNRERWRKQASGGKHDYDIDDQSDVWSNCNRHSRRNSDGGLFSCFGNAYGIEFTIVCGASNHPSSSKRQSNGSSRKNIKPSEANSA